MRANVNILPPPPARYGINGNDLQAGRRILAVFKVILCANRKGAEVALFNVQKIGWVRGSSYRSNGTQQRWPTKLINMNQVHVTLPAPEQATRNCDTQNKILSSVQFCTIASDFSAITSDGVLVSSESFSPQGDSKGLEYNFMQAKHSQLILIPQNLGIN